MARNRFATLAGRSAMIWLLSCVALLDGERVAAGRSTLCLTAAAEPALKDLFASPAFHDALGPGRHLEGANLRGEEIELRVADTHREQGIRLALTERSERAPDGRGQRFVYYLDPDSGSGDLESNRALLSVAALVDRTIPSSALAECNTPREAHATAEKQRAPYGEGYPRALALFSAGVQILALLAAVWFGTHTIRHSR